MNFRRFALGSLTLGVCALCAVPGRSQEPNTFSPPPATPVAVSDHQALATTVAQYLRQSPALKDYRVEVGALHGVVTLQGHVTDAGQRDEVLRLVRSLPGVKNVVDQLAVRSAVTPVASTQPPLSEPAPLLPKGPPQATVPVPNAPMPGPQGPIQEPTPIFQAPPNAGLHMQPPPLPPNAWPTYAPYNNFSRVATPTLYPPNAWPFIGPMYPFPKVPPGWRSISLNYYDGHWWYGKHSTGYDWWRIRYH